MHIKTCISYIRIKNMELCSNTYTSAHAHVYISAKFNVYVDVCMLHAGICVLAYLYLSSKEGTYGCLQIYVCAHIHLRKYASFRCTCTYIRLLNNIWNFSCVLIHVFIALVCPSIHMNTLYKNTYSNTHTSKHTDTHE